MSFICRRGLSTLIPPKVSLLARFIDLRSVTDLRLQIASPSVSLCPYHRTLYRIAVNQACPFHPNWLFYPSGLIDCHRQLVQLKMPRVCSVL